MGDVIRTERFPRKRTQKQRDATCRKFARRPLSRQDRRDLELPADTRWRR